MSKIRINELARQLEVKSREVIDKLHELGIAEKVTHSSSIDEDMADRLRRYYAGDASAASRPASSRNGSAVAVEEPPEAELNERAPRREFQAPRETAPQQGGGVEAAAPAAGPKVMPMKVTKDPVLGR